MRFYDIQISQTPNGPPVALQTASGATVARWTSHPNGIMAPPNPGALDVELSLYVKPAHTPVGASFVRIWGVDLVTMRNASQFAGDPLANPPVPSMFVSIKGGMGKGLPLANPVQAGLLATGRVFQCFGNFQGTTMSLDLKIIPALNASDPVLNIILNWKKGQPLGPAIQNALTTALPGMKITMAISPNLVASGDVISFHGTLTEFAELVNSQTRALQGPGSLGVQIVPQGNGILVYDGTVTAPAKQLAFVDLIGQPTWQEARLLYFQTPMRADLSAGSVITLPPELASLGPYVLSAPESTPSFRQQSAIQGQFLIIEMWHTGRLRDPAGTQWVSNFIATPFTPLTTTPTSSPPPSGSVNLGQPFVIQ
jgi:hypothetical protein